MPDTLPETADLPGTAASGKPVRQEKSYCRICSGLCGVRLDIDAQGRIAAIHGDKDHPLTQGYACIKGLQAPEAHHGPDRLLHPLKRMPDGSFQRIGLEQALDEIAAKLKTILERDGPEAVAGYRGTINVYSATASQMLPDWLHALGSQNYYTTMTIDQSAKWVTIERLGMWAAGRQGIDDADVWLLAGNNPLVSIGSPGLSLNPTKRMKELKARGTKLIVIDPRRSETARHADLYLQPYPGEDPTLVAGLLRIILGEGWEDREFCAHYVDDLEGLKRAVDPFTPAYVERRAGIPQAQLREAAEMFARGPGPVSGAPRKRGIAHCGTGVTMAPHPNLSDHLYECLNVVCGRYLREGERVPNPGILGPLWPRRAEVFPPRRSWESSPKSRIGGYGMLFGEKMSATLPDEILTPGKGQIKSLFVDGGNPVSAIPDQRKVVEAFRQLELLVTIDPYMTTTAQLSHYILPPKVFFEHADLPPRLYETAFFTAPLAAYTPAIIDPPAGSEVVEDWYVFWAIAKRLDKTIVFDGVELDMNDTPDIDGLHALLQRNAPVSFEEMKARRGQVVELEPMIVAPAPDSSARFATIPSDVAAELAAIAAEPFEPGHVTDGGQSFTHRLVSRRLRDVSNSMYRQLPAIRRRVPYNSANMHPDDLAALGLKDGDKIRLISEHGSIPAIVEADADVRPGVISMAHGWGGLPDESDYEKDGAYTGLLISVNRHLDPISAMPRQSAVPVNVVRR